MKSLSFSDRLFAADSSNFTKLPFLVLYVGNTINFPVPLCLPVAEVLPVRFIVGSSDLATQPISLSAACMSSS